MKWSTKVFFENCEDLLLEKIGRLEKRKARSAEVDAVVDTGAVMMLLPQDLVEALGLEKKDKAIVTWPMRRTNDPSKARISLSPLSETEIRACDKIKMTFWLRRFWSETRSEERGRLGRLSDERRRRSPKSARQSGIYILSQALMVE